MESMLPILLQLIGGGVGGNAAGAAMKEKSLGTIGNSITGIIGGVGGVQLLNLLNNPFITDLLAGTGAADPSSLGANAGVAGAGGAALLGVVALAKKFMKK